MTLANGDSAAYFEAAKEGRLVFQKCQHCDNIQFPPRHHCVNCWQSDLKWIESSGKGRVETYTIVRRAPLPKFRNKTPYVVASIIVEEGPRMITNLVGATALDVKIGDNVSVTFAPNADGEILPLFQHGA